VIKVGILALSYAVNRRSIRRTNTANDIIIRRKEMDNIFMLDNFLGKLNVSKWATMTKTSTDTALRDIHDLVKKDVLEQEEGGGRSTSYKLKDMSNKY